MLDRLSTGVRMRMWNVEHSCVFCGEKDETRDHLYLACLYTYTVWMRIVGRVLGNGTTSDWSDTMTCLQSNTFSGMDYVLIRLAFQVTVYLIWRERNARRNRTSWMGTEQMSGMIDRTICYRILALKYGAAHKFVGLLQRWLEIYDWIGQCWLWSLSDLLYSAAIQSLSSPFVNDLHSYNKFDILSKKKKKKLHFSRFYTKTIRPKIKS